MDSSEESKLPEEKRIREELADAFPLAIQQDALIAISVLSENRFSSRWQTFSLRLGYQLLVLPQRIYYVPPVLQTLRLSTLQMEILDCLFTRHHDGFVRQTHLGRIIRSRNAWIPYFVVPLVGEYVVEILQVICENLIYLLCGISALKSRISSIDRKACAELLALLLPLNQEARVSRFFDSRFL